MPHPNVATLWRVPRQLNGFEHLMVATAHPFIAPATWQEFSLLGRRFAHPSGCEASRGKGSAEFSCKQSNVRTVRIRAFKGGCWQHGLRRRVVTVPIRRIRPAVLAIV